MAWWPALLLVCSGVSSGETVLLDFSASYCGPCQQMLPLVRQLEAQGHPVRTVDIQQQPALAQKHNVGPIPCFVMLVDGKEVDRQLGATSRERLMQMLSKAGTSTPAKQSESAKQPEKKSERHGTASLPPSLAPQLGEKKPFDGAQGRARRNATEGVPYSDKSTPWNRDDLRQDSATAGDTYKTAKAKAMAVSARLKVKDPNGSSFGSGTVIEVADGTALVLTYGHLFRDSRGQGDIAVDLFAHESLRGLRGKLVGYDLKRDVGVVSVAVPRNIKAARVAHVGYRPKIGDEVLSVGCNHGADATVERSRVTSIDRFTGPPNLQVAGQPVIGRSGGGLFSVEGMLIGVCNAADPSANEGLFASVGTIHAELDHLSLSRIYRESTEKEPLDARMDKATPPSMPLVMPTAPPQRAQAAPPWSPPTLPSPTVMSEAERLALAAMRDQSAQVICYVRSTQDARTAPQDIVLREVSPEFLRQLAAQRQSQADQPLTSGKSTRPDPAVHIPVAADLPWRQPDTSLAATSATPLKTAPPITAPPKTAAKSSIPTASNWNPKWRLPKRGE